MAVGLFAVFGVIILVIVFTVIKMSRGQDFSSHFFAIGCVFGLQCVDYFLGYGLLLKVLDKYC
jgi:hypothetical protein